MLSINNKIFHIKIKMYFINNKTININKIFLINKIFSINNIMANINKIILSSNNNK